MCTNWAETGTEQEISADLLSHAAHSAHEWIQTNAFYCKQALWNEIQLRCGTEHPTVPLEERMRPDNGLISSLSVAIPCTDSHCSWSTLTLTSPDGGGWPVACTPFRSVVLWSHKKSTFPDIFIPSPTRVRWVWSHSGVLLCPARLKQT